MSFCLLFILEPIKKLLLYDQDIFFSLQERGRVTVGKVVQR